MSDDENIEHSNNMKADANTTDTALVTCTINRVRSLEGKRIYPLIGIELLISGISLVVYGIQARHASGGDGTSIHLPTYRDSDGSWRAAINLPAELKDSLPDQIFDHMVEFGVARIKAPTVDESNDAETTGADA